MAIDRMSDILLRLPDDELEMAPDELVEQWHHRILILS